MLFETEESSVRRYCRVYLDFFKNDNFLLYGVAMKRNGARLYSINVSGGVHHSVIDISLLSWCVLSQDEPEINLSLVDQIKTILG